MLQKTIIVFAAFLAVLLLTFAMVKADERDAKRCKVLYSEAHTHADSVQVDGMMLRVIGSPCGMHRLDGETK